MLHRCSSWASEVDGEKAHEQAESDSWLEETLVGVLAVSESMVQVLESDHLH